MHAVNVSTLKNKLTQALLWAQTQPVVVVNRDRPQAVLTEVNSAGHSLGAERGMVDPRRS